MKRQRILTRSDPAPPRLIYLLPETVLWYDVGGADVMRSQLEYLAEASNPRLSVQIVPNGARHPGNQGEFMIATMSGGEEIAFADSAGRGIMMDKREDICRLKERFDAIGTQALPTSLSADLISRTIREKWTT